MKKRAAKFAAMALAIAMLLPSAILTGHAQEDYLPLQITKGINLVLDGKNFIPTSSNGDIVELFAANGTTYVPMRCIVEAFGGTVDYDGETQSIIVTIDIDDESLAKAI